VSDVLRSDDNWDLLRENTQARIGLGRTGNALTTRRSLEFTAAHAVARDAVHHPLDIEDLNRHLDALRLGIAPVIKSRATNRHEYLRRPDLGRSPANLDDLTIAYGVDVGIVLADGLSPGALNHHGPGLLQALHKRLRDHYSIAPPVIATNARVALGDHIGQAMNVRATLMIIGERPGLSVAESLGIYVTYHPRPGLTDANRNCISNVHTPFGLPYEKASEITANLIAGAFRFGGTGVALKDRSEATDEVTAVVPHDLES
jgi:ethanolamine ammonia-lyase small subunit